jgi:hypothetical protein
MGAQLPELGHHPPRGERGHLDRFQITMERIWVTKTFAVEGLAVEMQ